MRVEKELLQNSDCRQTKLTVAQSNQEMVLHLAQNS